MSLFQKSVVNKYLKHLNQKTVEESYKKFQQFYGDAERIGNIRLLKEENYQEGFLREIFVDVLGYTINPDKNYNLTTEFKNLTDYKKADGAILLDAKAIGVIELKSTKTPDLESIRDQAFNYKNNQPNCKFVITSNFEKLRIYIDNATDWEEFNLFTLDFENFQKLYLYLSKDSIFNGITQKLKDESKLHEEDITNKLYNDYSIFKQNLFNDLKHNNPKQDKLLLFHKSQKLLDRILFVLFAEDRGLLPPNAITKIVEQWKSLKELDEEKSLYSRFVKLFHQLDAGHKYKEYELPAYNGGLFKKDDVLDSLIISDTILHKYALKLSTYDFNTEVDVNVLGHIFENSITEIEQVKAEIEGEQADKNRSRRKKEGIFYTPKYITKYIVDNTVGALCTEKKKELGINEIENEIIENSRTAKGKLSKKAETLLKKLNDYRDYLISLKILDPACGSGAFLNQALEFLINEHELIDSYRRELEQDSLGLYDITKSILENNLYGVDINEEAVEIAKLSLWIRTAVRGRKLSDLNSNIKCGNSLIDDPADAGDKAFDWNKEFPEIMGNGGFDVVIGNPPYVNANEIKKSHT
ncbi:MAG: DNA methyltransferase, partial [Ignavibacteriota bacterium]